MEDWRQTKMESSSSVRLALRSIIGAIAETDFERAGEIAASKGMEAWFEGSLVGDLDDPEVVDHLLERAEASGGGVEFFRLLHSRVEADPDGVMRVLQSLPSGLDTNWLFGWVGDYYPPEQAMDLYRHLHADALESDDWSIVEVASAPPYSRSALKDWAVRDPRAALAWAESLPANAREHFRAVAIVGAAPRDPEWAAAEADSLSGQKREQAMMAIAPIYFNREPEAALEWIDSVADVSFSQQLRSWATRQFD